MLKESVLKGLVPSCQTVVQQQIVDGGKVIAAGGVAASIDLGLYVVERFAGLEAQVWIATQTDNPYFSERNEYCKNELQLGVHQ